jgi:pimeloyl-ACP methyl ester carboxylesterase
VTRRTAVLAVLIAAVLVGAIALVAVTSGDDEKPSDHWTTPKPDATGPPSALGRFYTQKLSWSDCGTAHCTWVKVPIDYAKPDGGDLKLRVKVYAAEGRGGHSLFLNPGGPGASALSFTDSMRSRFGHDVLQRYDLVGVDPRGVGKSTPVDCLSDRDFDTYAASEPDPDDTAEIARFRANTAGLGKGCEAKSGALAAHISTEEAARDFDIVRALLGAKRFDWFGASYGTQLGATYATLFPKMVGRMVLDGAVDPSLSAEDSAFGQTSGFQRALEAYIKSCVRKEGCPLGRDAGEAEKKLAAFVEARDARPLRTGEKRELTEGLAFYGIAFTLYDKRFWSVLTPALSAAFEGDGSILLRLADVYFDRKADGSYAGNIGEANPAVDCLDTGADQESSLSEVEKSLPRFAKASPVFGPALAWGALICKDWPIKATHPQVPIDAKDSAPIVVLGTTRDPATPYEWSKALTEQLGSAVLVSRDGDGHTAYTSGNRCVKDAVDAYLVDGTVPKKGLLCKE